MNMQDYTNKITNIYSQKKWYNPDSNANDISLQKTIKMGERLSDDEREMIVYLFNGYLKISINNYTNELLKILNSINAEKYKSIKTYYILPIKQEKDKDKSKSGDIVSYLFETDEIYTHHIFLDKKICSIGKHQIPTKISTSSTKKLILVDDFIGSGESVVEYLTEINNITSIPKEKIIFIFIAGMQESIQKLKKDGYDVYCGNVQEKGISGIKNDVLKEKYKNLMNQVENNFNFQQNFRFGYKQSESLLTLGRTPNNTFPIFWNSKNKNAPFERR